MSRVAWLWGTSAKSAEMIDDDKKDEPDDDDVLQRQLNADVASEQNSQPASRKTKRKSRELNGGIEGDETEPSKRKKKRKKRKNRLESNDDTEQSSTALSDVLSHLNRSLGSQPYLPQVEHPVEHRIVHFSPETNGPLKTSKDSANETTLVTESNDSVERGGSNKSDSVLHPSNNTIKDLNLRKVEVHLKPNTSDRQTLKDSIFPKDPLRSSFATSNKAALLASIMKTCSSPAPAKPSNTNYETLLPKRNGTVQPVKSPPNLENLESSGPTERLEASSAGGSPSPYNRASPEASPEQDNDVDLEGSPPADQDFNPDTDQDLSLEPTSSPPISREMHKRKKDKKPASISWRTGGYTAPALPIGYKPGPKGSEKRYHCPVDVCNKAYSRKTTMSQHLNIKHTGAIYRDNNNGTLSIIGTEEEQESNSEDEDSPTEVRVSQNSTPVLANGQVSASNKDTHAFGEHAEDSSYPQKKRGRPKGSKNVNINKNLRNSRRSSGINMSYADSGRDKNEPVVARHTGLRPENPEKALLSHRPVSTLLSPRQDYSDSIMEPWEIATGRIRASIESDDGEKGAENIAFSSAYIVNNDQGITIDSIHFTVLHLPGGSAHNWTSDELSLRVCSVAAGKVHVTMGSKEFAIGAHGMWRIRGGEVCEIVNLNYCEAVVHISTMDDS